MIKKLKETINQQLETGSHTLLTNNPMWNTQKILNLTEWLVNLQEGSYVVDKELSNTFSYNEPWSLRTSIERIIKRLQISNIILEHNGRKTSNSRWKIVVSKTM